MSYIVAEYNESSDYSEYCDQPEYRNYDSEINKRISIIRKFIKNNPRNISFLWNQEHYINTTDEFNMISGQLVLEYCEDETWRPLTYKTPNDKIYCYIINEYEEIKEFSSSYQYADSFKLIEASPEEFTTFSNHHHGKTWDQIVKKAF